MQLGLITQEIAPEQNAGAEQNLADWKADQCELQLILWQFDG